MAVVLLALAALGLVQDPAEAEQRIKVECYVYGPNRVDPIALSEHLHYQFGNTLTTNESTADTLFASISTTCNMDWFTSAGWFPVEKDEPLTLEPVDVYYRAPGDQTQVQPIPTGLEIIADEQKYQCVGSGFKDTPPYNCKNRWNTSIRFPDCYSGSPVLKWDPANWRNSQSGVCPSSYSYRIPDIAYLIHHKDDNIVHNPLLVSAGVDEWHDYTFMHGDYFAANQPVFNDELLDLCLRNVPDSVQMADPRCGEIEGG